MWLSGNQQSVTSPHSRVDTAAAEAALPRRFEWVSITPLETPVVPLV